MTDRHVWTRFRGLIPSADVRLILPVQGLAVWRDAVMPGFAGGSSTLYEPAGELKHRQTAWITTPKLTK
ncbi:MAG: hypothetical protein ACU0CQ_06240 [Sulfitobacter sp.]|uniref:hypothetical protein n=1 Tax=Sulfitobacter sp. TaxID=1903071 RepID=UPI0040584E1F